MTGDTNKAPPGWEAKVDEHGSVHLVRPSSYVPPSAPPSAPLTHEQTSTATTTPSAAPPTSDSKSPPISGLIFSFCHHHSLFSALHNSHQARTSQSQRHRRHELVSRLDRARLGWRSYLGLHSEHRNFGTVMRKTVSSRQGSSPHDRGPERARGDTAPCFLLRRRFD